MKIVVSIDSAPDLDPSGTVSEIAPAADVSSHSFLVKIDLLPSKTLRAGMNATAQIPTGTKEAILAPRSAIFIRGSLACAYVLDSYNVAQLRSVTLGPSHRGAIEVLSGIAARSLSTIQAIGIWPASASRLSHDDASIIFIGLGVAGRLAQSFLNSKLTPLFIVASLALGVFAVAIIPREGAPQILVPMLDFCDSDAGCVALVVGWFRSFVVP